MERPTGLVVPAAGDVRAVAPSMFAEPLAPYAPLLWTDDDGPEAAIAAGLRGVRRLLVGGALPAAHLFLLRDAVADVALDPGIVAALRRRKTPAEIELLAEAGRRADAAVGWIGTLDLAGWSERRLAGALQAEFLRTRRRAVPADRRERARTRRSRTTRPATTRSRPARRC